jgi:hypothetical protein
MSTCELDGGGTAAMVQRCPLSARRESERDAEGGSGELGREMRGA